MQKCDMAVRNMYKNLGQNVYTLSIQKYFLHECRFVD